MNLKKIVVNCLYPLYCYCVCQSAVLSAFHLGPSHPSAQNASIVTHFVTSGNCGIPENMC
jgi:hypothetical protein